MDTFFYDNPMKAIIKAGLLLFTYCGMIFKDFSIEIVLPTVFLFFLTNIYDYGELAFVPSSKSKKIRDWSLAIFIFFLVSIVVTYCFFTTDNESIKNFANQYYIIFYLIAAVVWLIPFCDGIRGRLDLNCKEAQNVVKSYQSNNAYNVMVKSINKK